MMGQYQKFSNNGYDQTVNTGETQALSSISELNTIPEVPKMDPVVSP